MVVTAKLTQHCKSTIFQIKNMQAKLHVKNPFSAEVRDLLRKRLDSKICSALGA